jgi:hypothetical protein
VGTGFPPHALRLRAGADKKMFRALPKWEWCAGHGTRKYAESGASIFDIAKMECRRVSDVAETEPSGNIGRLAASLAMRAAGGEAVPVRRDATACRRSAAVNANGALTWWVA